MKKIFQNAHLFTLSVAIFIAVTGTIIISSCASSSSVTGEEAYQAGYTIGRMISGH